MKIKSDTQKPTEESQSERDLVAGKLKQRKKVQSLKKEILETAAVEIEKVRTVDNLSKVMSRNSSSIQSKLEQSRDRLRRGVVKTAPVGYYEIGGLEFCNPMELLNKEALERHSNDPNKRLDECGFPEDRTDRDFLLSHEFEDLNELVEAVKFSWMYIHGDPGRGKTSLATRIVWELIRDHPTQRATFLSVAKWTNSLRVGEDMYLPLSKLSRIVVVDDFDKFDRKKDFQVRQLLLLIEKLKNRHLVIITSNYSRDEILNLNPGSLDLEVMLDRVAGKSIDLPRLSGKSFRS